MWELDSCVDNSTHPLINQNSVEIITKERYVNDLLMSYIFKDTLWFTRQNKLIPGIEIIKNVLNLRIIQKYPITVKIKIILKLQITYRRFIIIQLPTKNVVEVGSTYLIWCITHLVILCSEKRSIMAAKRLDKIW